MMNGIDNIITNIRSEAELHCSELNAKASEECERIRAGYAQAEQDEYWSRIDAGTKDIERRMERLNTLAEMEANKQLLATQQEMIAEAFALAAKKISELPEDEYARLIERLDLKPGSKAEDVVARYKNELYPRVSSALFN